MFPKMTVGELLDLYARDRLARLRTGSRTERSLRRLLGEDEARLATDLTEKRIAGAVGRLASTARTHANRSLAYVRAFFEWAVREDLIAENPARLVDMPAEEARRDRILAIEELVEVWRAAEVLDYPFCPAIRVMLLTGMQREIVASMRRADVDFGEFNAMGAWRLPSHPRDFAARFEVALANLTRSEIFEAQRNSVRDSSFVFTTTGETPVSGWTRAKRKLDGEISLRRTSAGKEETASWRLDDLRRSLVANLEGIFAIDHGLAISCLHMQTGFGSLRQRFVAYSGCVDDDRASVLALWARLIEESSRPGADIDEVSRRLDYECCLTGLSASQLQADRLTEEAHEELLARGL